jgi:CubicO group peptidase (beta-lactamase class C family)
MKTFLTLVLFLFSAVAFSQPHVEADKLVADLKKYYNSNQYDALYNQLSEAYKKDATEAYITSFYKNNLRAPLGQITNAEFTSKTDNSYQYLVSFEKGNCDFNFVFTEDQHINGMQWSPSSAVRTAKKLLRDPKTIKSNNPKQTKLQLYIDSLAVTFLADAANSSLSIGIVDKDKTEQYFYGETKKGTGNLPSANSVYEIGSISKSFTGILLAHAVNEGKISLNDDIRRYLPGKYPNLEVKGKPVTVLSLANHTSGLPRLPENFGKQPGYKESDPYVGYSKTMIYEYLAKFKPSVTPGLTPEYSNFGIALVGIILENVYQQPLEKLLKEIITGPLKMTSTSYNKALLDARQLTSGYAGNEIPYWEFENFKAAGGINSNLNDMMLYLKNNITETSRDIKLSHQSTITAGDYTAGLAWMINRIGKHDHIWHNGQTAGFTSFIGYSPALKKGIVILNNSNTQVDEIAVKMLRYMETF